MPETKQTYFQQRMQALGITEESNKIAIWHYSAEQQDNALLEVPIFKEVREGISIMPFTLDRRKRVYAKEGSRHKINDYAIVRLEVPIVKKDGSVMKYQMPKGQSTVPFFPPALVEKYENKTKIAVLYITEGYFKAWKSQASGLDCVGIPSITCMRDTETGKLHEDISRLINTCHVERVVYLTDGDCLNISAKDITTEIDLSKRPAQFFNTICQFREMLSSAEANLYWAHINTENLQELGYPKGLDDLLCAEGADTKEIVKEATRFDTIKAGAYPGKYFVKVNLSTGTRAVLQYFNLHDVHKFYEFHSERRADLKEKGMFKFYGTVYKWDEKTGQCQMEIPADASKYFRCGDDYYEFVWVPNKHSQLNKTVQKRQRVTIKEDHGKDLFKHIPKYKDFCIVPDHENYQQVINSCFNQYSEFMHQPEEGDCEMTMDYIKHIFGDSDVSFTDEKGETQTLKRWELGLDYITLLYKKPQQVLPILCLVSTERSTGKTTFANWLKLIFTENMIMVGNEDLGNKFNSHWAAKLLICCDETKIDKHLVMERVKSLSTANSIVKEGKGVDQQQKDFFGKFILLSNNEDNFATIDEQEIRFWVMKVPPLKGKNVNMLEELRDEIPQFLNFLSKRPMVTKHRERHWFDNALLKTPELERVIANSKPSLEREIKARIAQWFEDFDEEELTLSYRVIKDELLQNKRLEDHYLKKVLHNMGWRTEEGNPQRIRFPRWVETTGEHNQRTMQKVMIASEPTRFYRLQRKDFTDTPCGAVAALGVGEELPF